MTSKYNLDTYDSVIKEIKNPNSIIIDDIISALCDWCLESHLIYQIQIIKSNGNETISISKPIHSSHPEAPQLKKNTNEPLIEHTDLIEKVISKLNNTKQYYINKDTETDIIYLIFDTEISELEFANQYFLYCYNLVKNENENVKTRIKERVFKLKSKEKIEHYIHIKQNAIENLAYRLVKEINPINSNELYEFSNEYNSNDCLKIVYIYLEKLLRFIEKEYSNYLNVNIRVPYRTILVNDFKITPKLEYVKTRLLSNNFENRVLQIAYEPILKIATINIQEKLTYYEFNYCCQFTEELYKNLKNNHGKISDLELVDWLFDLNLNTFILFDYITNTITGDIENYETNLQKIDVLYRLLKNYNQRQTRHFIRFNEKLPTIKNQIVSWIEEEIDYLYKKIKLEATDLHNSNDKEPKIKLLSGLSVAQLSYFFNLLLQAGIIQHKNQRDIFRFISDNFKTKMSSNISSDSISSKYYNVESTTKSVIRDKIIELLNLTKF